MQLVRVEDLASQIIKLTAGVNAATYKWLLLVAEYDDRCTWPNGDIHSCAEWLQRKCSLKLGAARERLRVAHALRDLPKISAAMARGTLSFSKARAVTRIATRANEDQLLALALQGTTEDAEHAVQQLRRGADNAQTGDKQQQTPQSLSDQQLSSRAVTHSWESDGFLVLKARLPAEPGKRLLHALETAMKANPGTTFTARRADALVALAEMFLNSENQPRIARHPEVVSVQEQRRPRIAAPLIQHEASAPVAA